MVHSYDACLRENIRDLLMAIRNELLQWRELKAGELGSEREDAE